MKFLLVSMLLLVSLYITAQTDFGAHPRGQQWQMLTSDEVRVIYPIGMEQKANRIANIINYMNLHNRTSIGKNKRRFDLVLQTQTTVPNGYVGLAPLRSEFYATPPQSNLVLGSIDWLDVLAIHEYRHIQQYINSIYGLALIQYLFGGELSLAGAIGLALPDWYLEGDAVITETALTNNGRGRLPFFTMDQRALAAADINLNYDVNRNGSFIRLVPDQYKTGYMILNKVRNDYGNDAPMKIMRKSTFEAGLFWAFSRGMKNVTKMKAKEMYKAAWNEKKQEWIENTNTIDFIETRQVTTPNPSIITRYRYARALSSGHLVARKSSFNKTDAIVLISNNEERKLTDIGINIDAFLSEGHGILAWNELTSNARRNHQNYSDIFLLDTKTNTKIKFTSKSRYFSPSVAPDGSRVAAIDITPSQVNRIVIMNIKDSNDTLILPNPDNYFLSRTAWTEDGNAIVSIAKYDSKICLIKINVQNGKMSYLTPWTNHSMESPCIKGSMVYFNASYSGIDNIFCTDLDGSNLIQQVTSVPIGAFEPCISQDGGEIYFSEYNHNGYYLSKQKLDLGNLKKISLDSLLPYPAIPTTAMTAEGGNILSKIPDSMYVGKPYTGLFNGLKLHSWSLAPLDNAPSFRLMMNNIMNDLSISTGVRFNINENNNTSYDAELKYARYYPELKLYSRLRNRSTYQNSDSRTLVMEDFQELSVGASVGIPWNWYNGNFINSVEPSIGVEMIRRSNRLIDNVPSPSDGINTWNVGFSVKRLRRMALQNVGPRLGVSLQANYVQAISGKSNDKINLQTKFYLPGLMANHSMSVRLSYQKEKLTNRYQYADLFIYARGYSTSINDTYKMISLDYGFPLLYPEIGIVGLTYFKRIRGNVFYDYGRAEFYRYGSQYNFISYGGELIFDNTFLNAVPTSFGIRLSLLKTKDLNTGRRYNLEFFSALNF